MVDLIPEILRWIERPHIDDQAEDTLTLRPRARPTKVKGPAEDINRHIYPVALVRPEWEQRPTFLIPESLELLQREVVSLYRVSLPVDQPALRDCSVP